MNSFKIGDNVYFSHKGRIINAIVKRINEKSVSVVGDSIKGRIHPSLLTKVGLVSQSCVTITKPNYNTQKRFSRNDRVKWNSKGTTQFGTILRVNQKSCSVLSDSGVKWRITPNYLSLSNGTISTPQTPLKRTTNPKPSFTPSSINTYHDLRMILIKTKASIRSTVSQIFNVSEMKRFGDVTIRWGNRQTYRNCGWYKTSQNLIQISASFKNAPEYVIKQIIWHELLHIHFSKQQGRQAHSPEFTRYEHSYPKYIEAEIFIKKYMKYLRSILS